MYTICPGFVYVKNRSGMLTTKPYIAWVVRTRERIHRFWLVAERSKIFEET